jgi:hypothetical protein
MKKQDKRRLVKVKIQEIQQAITEGIHTIADRFMNVWFVDNDKQCQEMKAKAGNEDVIWLEQKQYEPIEPKTETRGSQSTEQIQPCIKPENEPQMNLDILQMQAQKNKSKDFLQARLKEFDIQEKIDLEVRNKCELWKKLNSGL